MKSVADPRFKKKGGGGGGRWYEIFKLRDFGPSFTFKKLEFGAKGEGRVSPPTPLNPLL